jgi:DNA-directed RNA polymerase
MDASNIVLLIKEVINKYHFDVLTIHDCFGVHANFVETLSYIVKETFIAIYGDKKTIDRFHSHIINNIKAAYPGKVINDKSAKN